MNLLSKIVELQVIGEFFSNQISRADSTGLPYIREAAINTVTTKTKIEMWHEYGSKTFILSPELVEAFQHTDVPLELSPTEFKYPFECFTIESECPMFQTNMGYITINGQRIGREGASPINTLMYLSRSFIEKQHNLLLKPDGTVGHELEWDHSVAAFFPPQEGPGLETITVNMRDDMTIQDSCRTKKQGLLITELEEVDARNIMNIFYNTIMYINDPGRVPAHTEEYRRRKVKLKGRKKAVKTGYIYLKPPQDYVPLSKSCEGRKLEKRFIVRGHYRKQAHGPKYSLHTRRWIFPYWKGPEWAERLSRSYKVA